jgi:hypothetical protein
MRGILENKFCQGEGMFQEPAQIAVMDPFGRGGYLKSLKERIVFPEKMKKSMEVWILYLLTDLHESVQHVINVFLRLGEKIGKLDPFLPDPLNLIDANLKLTLKRDRLPLYMNEIIPFKGLAEGLYKGPDPALDFSGTVAQL